VNNLASIAVMERVGMTFENQTILDDVPSVIYRIRSRLENENV
jgi:hypothetical protein